MSIQKRGKGWLIKVYMGRGDDGKKKYYTETFYAPLKSMVVSREKELKEKFSRIGPKKGVATLGEWLDRWLDDVKTSVSDVTWRGYRKHVRRVKPFLGDLKLYELDALEVNRLLRENLEGLSPRTQKNIQDTLRTAIRAGINARVIPQEAMLGWKPIKVPRQSRPVLDREGLYRLAKEAERYKYGLAIRLLAVTGARIGEILGLTWDRVDFKRGAITIDRAVDVQKRVLKDGAKTANSYRTVILDEETVRLLLEHKAKAAKETVRPIKKSESLVFQAPDGRPVKYTAIRNTFRRSLKKAGLPEMRIHDIRHSVVTLLLSEGVPAITVAALVGHNVATTNETYAEKVKVTRAIDLRE